jgi:GT2 family glycosyltransferase
VAVLLVNWNSSGETIACIDSLDRSRVRPWRVFVVDNASHDRSIEDIRAAHPGATLILSDRNRGYAGGFNMGREAALEAGAEYLWLLNNDTLVEKDTLGTLLDAIRVEEGAVLSPRIHYRDRPGEIWYAGGHLDWRLKTYHSTDANGQGDEAGRIPVEWATGCSLFFTSDVARVIGPMEERYFLYLEDVDWSLIARRRGIAVYCVPEARVYHGLARSMARLDPSHVHYYAWRNYYLFVRRHGTWWQRIYASIDLISRIGKSAVRLAFWPAYRTDRDYLARTKGLIDFATGQFGKYAPQGEGLGSLIFSKGAAQ